MVPVDAMGHEAVLGRLPYFHNLMREALPSGDYSHLPYAFAEYHHTNAGRLHGVGRDPSTHDKLHGSKTVCEKEWAADQCVPPRHFPGFPSAPNRQEQLRAMKLCDEENDDDQDVHDTTQA